MCYQDHRKEGNSDVVSIPMGKMKGRALYIDNTSLVDIWMLVRHLAKKNKFSEGDIVVSLLTHTYEFSSSWKRFRIKMALLISRLYGSFISDREALEIVKHRKGKAKT